MKVKLYHLAKFTNNPYYSLEHFKPDKGSHFLFARTHVYIIKFEERCDRLV